MYFCRFNENNANIFDVVYLFKTIYSIVVIIQTFKCINKIHITPIQTHQKAFIYNNYCSKLSEH